MSESSSTLSERLTDPRFHRVSPKGGVVAMSLILLSLGVLFAASMLMYLITRLAGSNAPPPGSISIPAGLWVSTIIILVSSFTIQRAVTNVQRERQDKFRQALILTLLLSLAFVLVQTPSLVSLWTDFQPKMEQWSAVVEQARVDKEIPSGEAPMEAFVLVLIVIHALHVLGGLIPLFVVTLAAHQHRYDHEHYGPVKYVSMYWHFLDGVWVVMFGLFLVTA